MLASTFYIGLNEHEWFIYYKVSVVVIAVNVYRGQYSPLLGRKGKSPVLYIGIMFVFRAMDYCPCVRPRN